MKNNLLKWLDYSKNIALFFLCNFNKPFFFIFIQKKENPSLFSYLTNQKIKKAICFNFF